MRKTVVFDTEEDNKRGIEHPSDRPIDERLVLEYNGLPLELFCEWCDMVDEGLLDDGPYLFEWVTKDFNEEGERKAGSRWEKYRK